MFKLSILICSLPNRLDSLLRIYNKLQHQARGKNVQILFLGDNKSMTVGEKRNLLLSISNGQYVTFVDDDDDVSDDYVTQILFAISKEPDVICYLVNKTYNGEQDRIQRFSRNYGLNHRSLDKKYQNMLPNHLCVWRKEIIKEKFPSLTLAEDHKWAQLMVRHYSNEYQIDKILYFYNYNSSLTETQKR